MSYNNDNQQTGSGDQQTGQQNKYGITGNQQYGNDNFQPGMGGDRDNYLNSSSGNQVRLKPGLVLRMLSGVG